MQIENLLTLKIHKLTQEQYDREREAGRIDENALYLTPNEASIVEEVDPTVPAWAKEPTKPTYTATEVGLGNVDNTSDADKPISIATQNAIDELREELSESIVSEGDEWKVVDNSGNIIAQVDANGLETTTVIAQSVIVNGVDIGVKLDELDEDSDNICIAITDAEIDEICSNTIETYLNSISSEEVEF